MTVRKSRHKTEEPSELQKVLWLHGQFRRKLAPIGITPLQAGVLLHLHRHMESNMTNTAGALCLRLPTLSGVINDLVRKRWVTRRRSTTDTRMTQLRLSPRGSTLVVKIVHGVGQVARMQTQQD